MKRNDLYQSAYSSGYGEPEITLGPPAHIHSKGMTRPLFLNPIDLLLLCGLLALMFGLQKESFLLMHSIVELIILVVSLSIFTVAANTHRFTQNRQIALLGSAYLAVGLLNLGHWLLFPGMSLVPRLSLPDLNFAFSYASRALEAGIFLLIIGWGICLPGLKRLMAGAFMATLLTTVTFLNIDWQGVFYTASNEATNLKFGLEGLLIALLATVLLASPWRRESLGRSIWSMLVLAAAAKLGSEALMLTFDAPTHWLYTLAHFLRLVSFLYLFKILVAEGLARPFTLLAQEKADYERQLETEVMLTYDKIQANKADLDRLGDQVKRNERLVEGLFSHLPVALAVIDEKGAVIEANHKLLNLRRGAQVSGPLEGQVFWQTPEIIAAGLSESCQQVLQGRYLDLSEVQFPKNSSGVEGFFNVRGVPLYGDYARVQGAVFLLEDVSAIHQAQDSTNKALERADQAAQVKSRFMANMSHELRTPMNGILGMCQVLLESSDLSPEDRNLTKTIFSSSERMMEVLQHILNYTGKDAPSNEQDPFDLRRLLQRQVDLMAATAQQKGLELHCQLDENLPEQILGNPDRLEMILSNLLANAVKFTEIGKVGLCATWLPENDKRPLRIEVLDTGGGIPEDMQQSIFDHFTQVDETMTRKFGGLGLGLSIVKKQVEQLKGAVRVSSGTTWKTVFTLELPAPLPRKSLCPESSPNLKLAQTNRAFVLDPDMAQAQSTALYLAQLGLESRCFTTSRELLSALQSEPCGLLILPENLDGLGAEDTISQVRLMEKAEVIAHYIPIVLVLEQLSDEAEERACSFGATALLERPVNLGALSETLDQIGLPLKPNP